MGEGSTIEWTDHTFNPWWGCSKVSAACTHCYAESLANRFRPDDNLWKGERSRAAPSSWKAPLAWNRKAAKEGRRALVFCASMADVFEDHPALPDWRGDLWDLVDRTPSLTWLLLTKRPENVLRMVPERWLNDSRCDFRAKPECWPRNVWVGATVEDQERADERIPHLLRVPAPVRFVSAEPLLGPVDLSLWLGAASDEIRAERGGDYRGLQWVITGGESGPKARPSHPGWFRALRDQCAASGVAYLHKQNGEWSSLPEDTARGSQPVGRLRPDGRSTPPTAGRTASTSGASARPAPAACSTAWSTTASRRWRMGDQSVSDALVERARAAARAADEERRRLESLVTRLRAAEALYGRLREAVANKTVGVLVSFGARDEGVRIPEHLTVRALDALGELVAGETATILAELEVPRG